MIVRKFILCTILLSVLFLACKKDNVDPVRSNSGEIVYSNKIKGTLDTGRIGFMSNAEGKTVGLILKLWGFNDQNRSSFIEVEYAFSAETADIPEGQFVLREGDNFKYGINILTPDVYDVGSYNQKQLTFTITKAGDSFYSIEFDGIADTRPFSGKYLGRLGLGLK